jgi:hypothetical protein
MANTASLKNTVRSISEPLSVQCSSALLIRVSFSPANPTHIRFCTVPKRGLPLFTCLLRRGLFGNSLDYLAIRLGQPRSRVR